MQQFRHNPRKRKGDPTPRLKSGDFDYQRAYQTLSRVHDFTFPRKRNRNFTPQEKAAIKRQWNTKGEEAVSVKSGNAVFLPASRYMRKRYADEQWTKTNKGMVIPRAAKKARFVGEGKRRRIEFTLHRPATQIYEEKTIYFDLPESLICDAEGIHSYISMRRKEYNAKFIRLAINGYRGSTPYDPGAWEKYFSTIGGQVGPDGQPKTFVEHVDYMCDQMDRYGSTDFPITGFFISTLVDPKTGKVVTTV